MMYAHTHAQHHTQNMTEILRCYQIVHACVASVLPGGQTPTVCVLYKGHGFLSTQGYYSTSMFRKKKRKMVLSGLS